MLFRSPPASFILTGTSRLAATDHVHRLPLTPSSSRPATFLVVRSLPEGSRVLESISTLSVPAMLLSGGKVALPMQCQSLYKSSGPATCRTRVTCVVNLDRLRVLLGYSASSSLRAGSTADEKRRRGSGAICVVRYADLEKPPPSATIRLAGAITVLKILELGGRQLVVAGSVDGSAAAWQLECVSPRPHSGETDPWTATGNSSANGASSRRPSRTSSTSKSPTMPASPTRPLSFRPTPLSRSSPSFLRNFFSSSLGRSRRSRASRRPQMKFSLFIRMACRGCAISMGRSYGGRWTTRRR